MVLMGSRWNMSRFRRGRAQRLAPTLPPPLATTSTCPDRSPTVQRQIQVRHTRLLFFRRNFFTNYFAKPFFFLVSQQIVNGAFPTAGLRYPDTYASYQNYEHYPPPTRPEYPYSNAAGAYGAVPAAYPTYGEGVAATYGDHPPTPPSPSERSESPPQQHALAQGMQGTLKKSNYFDGIQ